MANKTTNYGLTKPLVDEFYDVNVQNGNMDIIDEELKKISENTPDVSGQIKTHNEDGSSHSDIRKLANDHIINKSNPHSVTKSQVGLGNVDNTSDENKPVSTAQATAIADAKKAGTDAQSNLNTHTSNKSNPHGVTAAQVGAIPTSQKGAASGVATLDGSGKVPSAQLPSMDYVPNNQKGVAGGVATLGSDKKVPAEQLPEISSVKFYSATIGTSWTENEDTGVKWQKVAISGVTSSHVAKVDHAYTGDGTPDGYSKFVEEENQYLNFITNGYAETYNGGITFYIFGDAPTVSIPIVVEVA